MWCAVVLTGGALGIARFLLWPYAPPVERADAVVVLAGDYGDRLRRGLELMRSGLAPTLVLDGQPDSSAIAAFCQSRQEFEVVCLRPDPDSTRTEARAAGALAAQRGWRTLIVVTNRSHTTRAGLLFRRCVAGRVTMVATEPPYGYRTKIGAIRHEALGLAVALVRDRSC